MKLEISEQDQTRGRHLAIDERTNERSRTVKMQMGVEQGLPYSQRYVYMVRQLQW